MILPNSCSLEAVFKKDLAHILAKTKNKNFRCGYNPLQTTHMPTHMNVAYILKFTIILLVLSYNGKEKKYSGVILHL